MNIKKCTLTILMVSAVGMINPVQLFAQEDYYNVSRATPDMALQGTINLDVEIIGDHFDKSIDNVEFIASCSVSESEEPCIDPGWVQVNHFSVRGPRKIIANINVLKIEGYPLPSFEVWHDVRVMSSSRGRGGKGTTLFKVQSEAVSPSECNYNFEAEFDDLTEDGVSSDKAVTSVDGIYNAGGGKGFRLDTNGSQKLESRNDSRFVRINFSNAMPDNSSCDEEDINNAAGAAGFCDQFKGIDLRIEHQIQDLEEYGLCTMKVGDKRRLAMRLGFQSEDGALLQDVFKNGKQSGSGTPALSLSYGCLAPNLLQADIDDLKNWPLVSRIDDITWRIEATRACMHTTHGHKLESVDDDGNVETIYLEMPFGLTIKIVESQ